MILEPLNCSYREDRRMLRELSSDTSPKEVYLDFLQRTMLPAIWEQIVLNLNQFSYVVPGHFGRESERVFSIVLATDRRMSPSEKERMEEAVQAAQLMEREAIATRIDAESRFRHLEDKNRRPLVRFAMWLSDLWERAWK